MDASLIKIANAEFFEGKEEFCSVACPECCYEQQAPFAIHDPARPLLMQCRKCDVSFIAVIDEAYAGVA